MSASELALRNRLTALPTEPPAAEERGDEGVLGHQDTALLARFRAGERQAFEELVRKYQKPIYFLCLRHVRDPDDATDLAQRSFVKAFQGLPGFRGSAQFKTWLYRIAINLALNHLRDRARFLRGGDEIDEREPLEPGPAPLERLERAEQAQKLRAAIARLPQKQRLTLELRTYEDLPFREVAEIVGTSENAAKVNYHYAVRRLRQLLGEPEPDEPSESVESAEAKGKRR